MYTAIDVAKHVINYCDDLQSDLSNLRLQYYLYVIWILYYQATKQRLFWDMFYLKVCGPIIPPVYFEFCSYGGLSIHRVKQDKLLADMDRAFINSIINQLSPISTFDLSNSLVRKNKQLQDLAHQSGCECIISPELLMRTSLGLNVVGVNKIQ